MYLFEFCVVVVLTFCCLFENSHVIFHLTFYLLVVSVHNNHWLLFKIFFIF